MRGFLSRITVRNWRGLALLFTTSTLLESLAFGHITAFTPLFLTTELGVPESDVAQWTGLLTTATFAVAFPLAPLWGALAERFSRKLIVVRSQYIEAVGYVLCAFAPDLTWFFIARMLLGLTFGNIAIVIATQSLLTPDRRVASAISWVQAANPIAVSIGPPLGALLIPIIGIRGLFLMDGIGCLVAAILITLLMPEPPNRAPRKPVLASMRGSMSIVWRQPVLRLNFAAWFLIRGATGVVETYLPVRIGELTPNPAPAIGLILGVYGVLTTLATAVAGRFVERIGPTRLFWPAMMVAAVAVAGAALAPTLWLLAAFAWVRSVPVALTGTVLYTHLTQVGERASRATVMSLTPVPRNMAQFTLPLLAAGFATVGTAAALLVGAASYAAAAAVGWRLQTATRAYLERRAAAEENDTHEEAPLADAPLDHTTR